MDNKQRINIKNILILFLYMFVIPITVIASIHVISLFTFDKIIEYKKVPFRSANIPAEINGYKIAFITDTHSISEQELQKVVVELNKLQPDLLLLGGDLTPLGETPSKTLEILSGVAATDGIYGVEGNHDNYEYLFEAMEQYGMHPLSNSGVRIQDGFYLAGVEDLWRSPDIEKATQESRPDDFVLLLAHNPDVTMKQDTTYADLILSGHTHGGQITFFGIWAPYFTFKKTITAYGQRFVSGWSKSRDGVPVYVSNGTGDYFFRIFARPQVILITLTSD